VIEIDFCPFETKFIYTIVACAKNHFLGIIFIFNAIATAPGQRYKLMTKGLQFFDKAPLQIKSNKIVLGCLNFTIV